MKKKALYTLIIALIFSFMALTPAAHAGNVQRHRWEGIAIGLGAAIIGSAILNQQRADSYDRQAQETIYQPRPLRGDTYSRRPHQDYGPEYHQYPSPNHRSHKRDHSSNYRRPGHHKENHRRGHWKMRKEWVPPTLKRVWNPGHYGRHGKWISGHWIMVEDRPGYWTETRVWVARR